MSPAMLEICDEYIHHKITTWQWSNAKVYDDLESHRFYD
jgi:hypothetical protein